MPLTIDTCVHPAFADSDDIRHYIGGAWATTPHFPKSTRFSYVPPVPEFPPDFMPPAGGAGSDPAVLHHDLVETRGVDHVVLLPLMRGLLPDEDFASALCAATNDWLAETWLNDETGRYFGSIRVNPGDPAGAVKEIERWADHPRMVQVGVPLQAHHPYGHRSYLPVWEAAAQARLPVAVRAEIAPGVELWPTAIGYPRTFFDFSVMESAAVLYHLSNLILEGVFDRFETLVFVFADGSHDLHLPFLWRLDKDWRPYRLEVPWMKAMPSEYVRKHVRFVSRGVLEGPSDSAQLNDWLHMANAAELLMFGSGYPYWTFDDPTTAFAGVADDLRARIMGGNAASLYDFGRRTAT
jgi:predicted TIM-barrel fold metal-dependent hydrolase